MVTNSLETTRERLVEQAQRAQALAAETAAELLPSDALPGQTRAEVHVLLPGGRNYCGTALKAPLSLDADCVPDGYGKMQFGSCDVYVGGFRAGLMHGRGRWE